MSDLERMLTQLGRELDYPPTPDLTAAVASRLRRVEKPSPRRRPRLFPPAGLRRALVLALVGLLVLAGTVLAAVPGTRDAVLEFFGLQGATVERTATLPTPPAQRSLDLGRRTTLERARERLAFEPLVPTLLGDPDFVYLGEAVQGGELSLAYRPGPDLPRARTTRLGLLVSEFRGDLLPEYTGKIAGQATRVERVRVDGHRAIWLEGAPHYFFYRAPGEPFREEGLRIAQNVLLLEHGRVLVRLEGAFSKERALDLARSLR